MLLLCARPVPLLSALSIADIFFADDSFILQVSSEQDHRMHIKDGTIEVEECRLAPFWADWRKSWITSHI
ncbi:hypothetical protein Y886_18705 [Xanthomonas hyacinthi DSM 19077]|nr:hypothetical protein Y886_18705 [Xanthomonas hyacinthi DSM 19077]